MSSKETANNPAKSSDNEVTSTPEPTSVPDKTQIDLVRSKPAKTPKSSLEGKCIKDRYQLETQIGSGGMSDIYRAKDLALEKAGIKDVYVAIKVLQPEFVKQPEALQLLLKEADKTRRLSHPNIIRLYDVDSDGDIHFLVMEYLDGETLDQVIKRSKPKGLKLDGAIKILNQMCSALSYAHQSGIVHTDLKPANIILTRDGHIKLLDFGVAQAIQVNHDKYSATDVNQTAPHGGYTPAYASPELLAGNLPSIKDDVFAFACVAYELLTSKHPFDRLPADKAKSEKKSAAKPKHINNLQWKALQQALSFDQAKRTENISTVIEALNSNPWPKVAIAATVAVSIGLGGWFSYLQQNTANQALDQVAQYQEHATLLDKLGNMSSEQFLKDYPTLTSITEIEKQGLLRIHKQSLINAYEKKVDQALNDGAHEYPNYPRAETLLADIIDYFPDSQILAKQALIIQRGKQAAIEALDERLHALLRKGHYEKSDNDIYYLLNELQYIDNTYSLALTATEISTYKKQFNAAIQSHDVQSLKTLIHAGNVFFSESSDTEALIALGQELSESVSLLAQYNQAKSEGETPEYPYQAATVLYKDSFDNLNLEVNKTRTVATMDELYDRLESLSKELPADFTPLLETRKNMADKYLNLADELLKKRKVSTANRVMKRANKLISSTNI